MSCDHVPNKVILCVLYHSKCHNMEECVSFSIRNQRICSSLHKHLKGVLVKLCCCDMDRILASCIFHVRVGVTVVNESFYHEGITSQDCLIKG